MLHLQVANHVSEDIHGSWDDLRLRDICPFVELSSHRLRELEIITESEFVKGLRSDDDEWSLNGNFNDDRSERGQRGTNKIGSEFDYLNDHVLLDEIQQELQEDIRCYLITNYRTRPVNEHNM